MIAPLQIKRMLGKIDYIVDVSFNCQGLSTLDTCSDHVQVDSFEMFEAMLRDFAFPGAFDCVIGVLRDTGHWCSGSCWTLDTGGRKEGMEENICYKI